MGTDTAASTSVMSICPMSSSRWRAVRGGAQPLEAREQLGAAGLGGERRDQVRVEPAGAPPAQHPVEVPAALAGHGGAHHPGAVEDQALHPLGVRGGEHGAERAALGGPQDRGPLDAGGVHHGAQVVGPGLERQRLLGADAVGEAHPPLVEQGDPGEATQVLEEPSDRGVLPLDLDVGGEAGDQHDVGALAEGLVGDRRAVGLGVAGLGDPGGVGERGRRRRLLALDDDGGDEAVAPSVPRADHRLALPVVAHRLPRLLDAGGERGLRHEAAAPRGIEELGLGHHPVAVLDEVDQHAEHLRLERDLVVPVDELEGAGVERQRPEPVAHGRNATDRLGPGRGGGGRPGGACHLRGEHVEGAHITSTLTGTPLVSTSNTTDRATDCSTRPRRTSAGASPSISNAIEMRS